MHRSPSLSSLCSLLSLYYLSLSALIAGGAATCYFPSGLTADNNSSAFAPCNSKPGAVSMCCNFENGDSCTPEGLCLSGVAYYRDMCTDQTWQAPECVRQCMDVWNPRMTPCDDGTWCCGAVNTTCCSQKQGFKIAVTTTATSAFSLRTPSPTATGSGSASVTSQDAPGSAIVSESPTSSTGSSPTAAPVSKAKSKDNSVAIGAGVGVPVGVILVALIAGYCIWKRRRQNRRKAVELPIAEEAGAGATGGGKSSRGSSPRTRYPQEGIEDGSVMSALASGGSPAFGSPRSADTHSASPRGGGGEIHEIGLSARDRVHELPVDEQGNRRNVYEGGSEKM